MIKLEAEMNQSIYYEAIGGKTATACLALTVLVGKMGIDWLPHILPMSLAWKWLKWN